jgi:hypothetical protein
MQIESPRNLTAAIAMILSSGRLLPMYYSYGGYQENPYSIL